MSTSDFDRDDELRALLASGDPAGSLPSADQAALANLLEDIMSADLDVRPERDEVLVAGSGRRTRTTWLVAAAAAAVIAGTGGFLLNGLAGDDPAPPSAGPSTSTAPQGTDPEQADPGTTAPVAGETTQLTVGADVGRCVGEPTPELLGQYQQAFTGTVTAIDAKTGTMTMTATGVFMGEVGQSVQVTGAAQPFGAMLRTIDFKVGQTYNVAVYDGQVAGCGFSGIASGETGKLFTEAFPR